ncbi:GntR family transcriptional regulator [Kribbella deserti]|uniref:GntR family transcriptional regulator n=1 Tax=Kribbella deserti TaxID=1926257 RepID=A0ABV6QFB5_9ACTN
MTAPRIAVDTTSAVPAYEQLRTQVVGLVAAGQLEPGARLPSVRQLATDLGIAPGTVGRAYRELENAGVIETRRRTGTHVAAEPPVEVKPTGDLLALAVGFVRAARAEGAGPDDILAAVGEALRQ